MASSRKSTSSKSYQEGPRKKPLRQKDHVEAQATIESDTSAQKRRYTPKSTVASKSKTTTDSSKTQKVDSSKMKVTKKKMTAEERERSDKKPFSKEHTPPDIQSTAPSSSSSSLGAAAAASSSTSQGAEKPGVSSSTNKSSESSVGSSGTAACTKTQSGDNATTSGTSTTKKSSSVPKSAAGATMKKSRMSQSETKKDSSRERKMGVVSCGPINANKSEHKTSSKTKTAKVIPSDSATSNLSSSQPVINISDAKVPVAKKNCSTDPKNEPPKPLSGLMASSSNDSNTTNSTELTFQSLDLSSSNGRLKRCLIQEQAFDECEEDSICTAELNTSSSFSLTTTEIKKIEPAGDSAERIRTSSLKFEPTLSLKPESPVSTIQLSQSELQKQKREHHLRELQLADPSLSVKINLQKKLNLENSVGKDGAASNNILSHPPIVRHSSSPAKVESSFQYRRSKDHLALVEVLRKFGLSHCIRFFSHEMTLAKFMTLTCDDILETYQVTNPLTRKQLQHVITQLKAEEDTDTEVRC